MRDLIKHILKEYTIKEVDKDDEINNSKSSNENDNDTKKLFKVVRMIMEDMILPEYNHVICSYDISLDKDFNQPLVTVTFIGGYGTKLWPVTQGIYTMYNDVLNKIWNEIYDYTNAAVGVQMKTTPKCEDKKNIYLKENNSKDKNKKFLKDKFNIEIKGDVKLIQSFYDIPSSFRNDLHRSEERNINRLLNHFGPMYFLKINDDEILYSPEYVNHNEFKSGLIIKIKNSIYYSYDEYEDNEYMEILGLQDTGLSLMNIIDLYYKEEDDNTLNESKSKDKEYSPAGKEIVPKDKIFHQSNTSSRDKIMEQGLKARAGECYKIYVGYGEKCIPAIFATNTSNKRAWFDSTYDDDIWEIDTTKIPNVKWYKDRHYESKSKHIVTFENIPKDAIKLIYEGSGKDSLMESEDKSEDKKLKLVKEMIYNLIDEVEFIEVDTNYQGKPLIKIYHDVEDNAANYDNWLQHQIQNEIQEMTGNSIILCPWWAPEWDINKKLADFFIDVIKIKYDNEGNVINESEDKKEKKFNNLLKQIEEFSNSTDYGIGVSRIGIDYDEVMDNVVVNVFFDRNFAIGMGGYLSGFRAKIRSQIQNDLEGQFPLKFVFYSHYE